MKEEASPPNIFLVRPYHSRDYDDLRRIAADTAFFGEPIEAYFEDRNLFLDAFYAYYTDFEPEHAWVACANGVVVGFLVGCVYPQRYHRALRQKIIPRVLMGLIRGKYRLGPKSLRYLAGVLGALVRGEIPGADEREYPAHLHINIEAGWRGYGLGRKLIETYLEQLRRLGVRGVYLQTTNLNEAACHLYEKLGFRLLAAHQTRMWDWLLDQPVENRCYGLRLMPTSLEA